VGSGFVNRVTIWLGSLTSMLYMVCCTEERYEQKFIRAVSFWLEGPIVIEESRPTSRAVFGALKVEAK
jgi:hypothetical protein